MFFGDDKGPFLLPVVFVVLLNLARDEYRLYKEINKLFVNSNN